MSLLGVLCSIYLVSGGVAHFKEAGVVEQVGGNGLRWLLEYQAELILSTRFVMVHWWGRIIGRLALHYVSVIITDGMVDFTVLLSI